ncbi:MAG TPA: hypothetical protein VLG16_05525 [Candidatus Saccharimonadales bacterium]|nr:hypothetical protein [Candidatus Saccharimonadales bacterium]
MSTYESDPFLAQAEWASSGVLIPQESLGEQTLKLPVIPKDGPMPRDPYMQPDTGISAMLRNAGDDRYDTTPINPNNKPPLIPGWMKLAGAVALTAAVTAGVSYFEKPAEQTSSVQQQGVLPSPSFITTPYESASTSASDPNTSNSSSSSSSPSASPTPTTSVSTSLSPSSNPAKTTTPKPTKSVVVVASPTPTHNVPTAIPSTSPSSANVCSWPMSSQGDSEVRDTCANGAAMEAYNSADKNSGESFAIYPGLYVHDIAQVGAYTEVSIGGGNNVTVGYVLSSLIGKPYGQ